MTFLFSGWLSVTTATVPCRCTLTGEVRIPLYYLPLEVVTMPEALIVSSVRTPIGRAVKGSLREVRPDDLAATAIAAAVARSRIDPATLADHVLGTAYPEGKQGANIARRASLLAGLPVDLPGTTINRFCASSLQALRVATHALWSGEAGAYLISGVESISQVGRTTSEADKHPAFGTGQLCDVYIPMGVTAE